MLRYATPSTCNVDLFLLRDRKNNNNVRVIIRGHIVLPILKIWQKSGIDCEIIGLNRLKYVIQIYSLHLFIYTIYDGEIKLYIRNSSGTYSSPGLLSPTVKKVNVAQTRLPSVGFRS